MGNSGVVYKVKSKRKVKNPNHDGMKTTLSLLLLQVGSVRVHGQRKQKRSLEIHVESAT